MNIAHLKSRILDLAVRGKLTEQRPEDGSAAELLARVREEKQRLIAAGKIKKEKPLPEITEDEKPFNIPAGWEWCRLPELCTIPITDGTHQTPVYSDKENGIPFLSSKDVTSQKIDWSRIKYITKDLHEILYKRIAPQKYDVLLAKNGTTGVAALVEDDIVFDIYVTLAVLRPDQTIIYPQFLLQVINSPVCKKQFDSHLLGIGVPNLHLYEINKTLIPLPPLTEQKRIVEKIEQLFRQADIIEQNRLALKTRIRQTRSRVLDLAVRGKLTEQRPEDGSAAELLARVREEKQRLIAAGKIKKEKKLPEITEDEKPFNIPAGWEWCRYMDLFTHSSGKALKQSDTDGIKREYITTSNVYWNRFDFTEVRTMYFKDSELEKCTAKKGDLLLCNGGDVGRAAIWNYDYDICIQNHISRLRPISPQIQIKYFSYLLWYYKNNGLIAGKGIGISSLTVNEILSLTIPLPPLAEQKRIVEKIEQIFTALNRIENAIEE